MFLDETKFVFYISKLFKKFPTKYNIKYLLFS